MPGDRLARNVLHILAMSVVFFAVAAPATRAPAQPPTAPVEMLEDAELTDVTFLDPDRGFAVGDRGAIWRTEDGGRHWRLIPSPIGCRWESVFFLDEQNGWIVGGHPQQLTHQSVGVILRTRDGGRTWQQVEKLVMPALKQIRFFDAKNGWAVGHVSNFFPSGVFRTSDAGQTWSPLPGPAPVGWLAGAMHNPQRGTVVGPDGQVGIVSGQELKPARVPTIGPRPVRRVLFNDEQRGWLIGDGGLVLSTESGGLSWTMPSGEVPAVIRENLDCRALALRGSHIWIAGAPGSILLHSPDRGASWEVFRTDHAAPLKGLSFIDDYRGWAVGAGGTILATRDGGKTWLVQRRGTARVALLNIFSDPQRVPLEIVAKVSGNDGYLSATEILNRRDLNLPRAIAVPCDERSQAAVSLVGGSATDTAWRFPLRDDDLKLSDDAILELWNRANDGRGAQALESHVVRKIRQWRPDVIITERSSPRGEDPLAHLTNQIVLAAVEKAGDATSYPEQITWLGLEPWKAKKVLSTLPPETPGAINVSTAQLAPRLGGSLADVTAPSRGLVFADFRPAARQQGFQLLINRLPQELAERDIMSGISLTPGSDGRRTLSETSPTTLENLRREAQRSRNIQQLMSRSAADAASGGSWLGAVDDMTKGLSKSSAASTLYELAWRYHRSGQTASAADAFQLLVDRYPEHDLADVAALWLVQFHASSEAGARLRRGTRSLSADSSLPEKQATYLEEVDQPGPRAERPASASIQEKPSLLIRSRLSTAAPGQTSLDRAHLANDLAKRIEQTRPRLYAQPELRFSLAAAQRQIGFAKQAEAIFHTLGQQRGHDAWWACAQSELWLIEPTPSSPKPTTQCRRVEMRPKLDGQLDDEIWKGLKPLELRSVDRDVALPPAVGLLAHDGEFLYLAVSCRKLAGVNYPPAPGKRSYDDDLSARDRVEMFLDLDRDYATYYSLAIDSRGCTTDACLGDATWNPRWFVAASQTSTDWTVEVAIPLAELDTRPPQPRDAWAIGLQRVMPGAGLSSWNEPAAAQVLPEGFGLLLWE